MVVHRSSLASPLILAGRSSFVSIVSPPSPSQTMTFFLLSRHSLPPRRYLSSPSLVVVAVSQPFLLLPATASSVGCSSFSPIMIPVGRPGRLCLLFPQMMNDDNLLPPTSFRPPQRRHPCPSYLHPTTTSLLLRCRLRQPVAWSSLLLSHRCSRSVVPTSFSPVVAAGWFPW